MNKKDESSMSSILVAVRVKPFTETEKSLLQFNHSKNYFPSQGNFSDYNSGLKRGGVKRVVHAIDEHMLVFDPPEEAQLSGASSNTNFSVNSFRKDQRNKDLRFVFDRVFNEEATQSEVYEGTCRELLDELFQGFNVTVFAYGATGCGKTHTISGTKQDPGVVFQTMSELFSRVKDESYDKKFSISLSYLEVYNETLRDLLIEEGDPKPTLTLREDPKQGVFVSNLSVHFPETVDELMDYITIGNKNRTVSPTEANSVSSRSHAVLQVTIRQTPKASNSSNECMISTLSFIDLAGSERAAVTKNRAERMVEGANINRSLLALGNCINALCQGAKKQHIPYRNSKLTRLLKFSLGGNCKTVMIVCVSPSNTYYEETLNTLKYANRAKSIKTRIAKNTISVSMHVSQYNSIIQDLKNEVKELKAVIANGNYNNNIKDSNPVNFKVNDTNKLILEETRNKVKAGLEKVFTKELDLKQKAFMISTLDHRIRLLKLWIETSNNHNSNNGAKAYLKTAQSLLKELEAKRSGFLRDSVFVSQSLERIKQSQIEQIEKTVKNARNHLDPQLIEILHLDKTILENQFKNSYLDFVHQGSEISVNQSNNLLGTFMSINATTLLGLKEYLQQCKEKGIDTQYLNKLYLESIKAFTDLSKDLPSIPSYTSIAITPIQSVTPSKRALERQLSPTLSTRVNNSQTYKVPMDPKELRELIRKSPDPKVAKYSPHHKTAKPLSSAFFNPNKPNRVKKNVTINAVSPPPSRNSNLPKNARRRSSLPIVRKPNSPIKPQVNNRRATLDSKNRLQVKGLKINTNTLSPVSNHTKVPNPKSINSTNRIKALETILGNKDVSNSKNIPNFQRPTKASTSFNKVNGSTNKKVKSSPKPIRASQIKGSPKLSNNRVMQIKRIKTSNLVSPTLAKSKSIQRSPVPRPRETYFSPLNNK